MKRWLKKHGKWVVIGLGVLFIANASWGIFTAVEEWVVFLHAGVITVWLGIILIALGALDKLIEWWNEN